MTVSELRIRRTTRPSSSVLMGVSEGVEDSLSIAIGMPGTGVLEIATLTARNTAVGVTVGVFVGVRVGVTVGVLVNVDVGVTVGVLVGVFICVTVGVEVGVFV